MFAKAMKSSVIMSVILLFVSIDCNSSDDIKEMCNIFKPNGNFNGVKVYKTHGNKLQMYGKGKEWQFVATNKRIVLLSETLTPIKPKLKTNVIWNPSDSQYVSLRLDFIEKHKEYWLPSGECRVECFV